MGTKEILKKYFDRNGYIFDAREDLMNGVVEILVKPNGNVNNYTIHTKYYDVGNLRLFETMYKDIECADEHDAHEKFIEYILNKYDDDFIFKVIEYDDENAVDKDSIVDEIFRDIIDSEYYHNHTIIRDSDGELKWKPNKDIVKYLGKISVDDLEKILIALGYDRYSQAFRKLYRNLGVSLFEYWNKFYFGVAYGLHTSIMLRKGYLLKKNEK